MPVHLNKSNRQTLPKGRILRGTGSFDRVFENSKRIKGRTTDVRFLFLKDHPSELKVGFVSGKKTGNAVTRNRNKRLMREAFRKNKHIINSSELSSGVHILFISHGGPKNYAETEKDVIQHLRFIKQSLSKNYTGL
jgi:ribonuclease P protein component